MSKDNKSIKSRFLAFMLALVMIIGVMPLNVIAEQLDIEENTIKSDVVIENKDNSDIKLKEENKKETTRTYTVTFNPNGGGGSTACRNQGRRHI